MTRDQLLAAEIFAYSFDNYANHLGIGNLRFEKHMPKMARMLERAENEHWDDAKVAAAIEVEASEVPQWRKRYRDAVEVVDAATPALLFRNGVRQSIVRELERHPVGDAEIESLVTQVCYRAADLAYVLAERREKLADYSKELREEGPGGEDLA